MLADVSLLLLFFISIVSADLNWDDPDVQDTPCSTRVQGLPLTTFARIPMNNPHVQTEWFVTISTQSYDRWLYEAVTNTPAQHLSQLDALKPRVIIPNLTALKAFSVVMFKFSQPVNAKFPISCIPRDFSGISNYTCWGSLYPGEVPSEFQGNPYNTVMVWADDFAWAEWRCLGNKQVYNVMSRSPVLTPDQIKVNMDIAMFLGFNPSHIVFHTF